MAEPKNVAILGATGAVGTQMLECLAERDFPVGDLHLLASPRSVGKVVEWQGRKVEVELAAPEAFEGVDIVLGAAGDDVAMSFLLLSKCRGATVVDNSHAFRLDADVPLVVPEINPEDGAWNHGLIANPNCATIIGLVPTWPLHKLGHVTRMVVSTYQAASGAGVPTTERGVPGARAAREILRARASPTSAANNLIPRLARELAGQAPEEMKMQ